MALYRSFRWMDTIGRKEVTTKFWVRKIIILRSSLLALLVMAFATCVDHES